MESLNARDDVDFSNFIRSREQRCPDAVVARILFVGRIVSFYVKTLILGGIGLSSSVGAGVIGWQLSEEMHPTLDRLLSRMGYTFDVTKPSKNTYSPTQAKKFNWGAWDCFGLLFPGVTVNHELSSDESSSDVLSGEDATLNNVQDNDVGSAVGCADMKMHPWKDKESNYRLYFQVELAVRNQKVGVVLWTSMLHGKLPDSNNQTSSFDFYHRMILLKKESDQWRVKSGYEWIDNSVMTEFNADANVFTITTPDGDHWFKQQSIHSSIKSREWLGLWKEQGVDQGNHPLKDIVVQTSTTSEVDKVFYELYGLDEAFVVKNAEHTSQGYQSINAHYDANISKWKKVPSSSSSRNKTEVVKAWYSPFQQKKGKWTEIGRWCQELRGSSFQTWTLTNQEFRKLCFRKR